MSKRRVIYLRNPSSGSNFRTIFGGASIGGGKTRRHTSVPNFLTFPSSNVGVPGLFVISAPSGVQQIRQELGFSDISDWARGAEEAHMPQFAVLNTLVGWNPKSWTEFMFKDTYTEKFFVKYFGEGALEKVVSYTPFALLTAQQPSTSHFVGTVNEDGNIDYFNP